MDLLITPHPPHETEQIPMKTNRKKTALAMMALAPAPLAAAAKPSRALDYTKTPNRYVDVEGTRYAYRAIGDARGKPPLVLFQHFTGTMDDWDSALIDGLARSRRLYVFDSAGVGASGGTTPGSVPEMARIDPRRATSRSSRR